MKKTGKFLEYAGLTMLVMVALLFNSNNSTFIQSFVCVCTGLAFNRFGVFIIENWEDYNDTI